MKRLGKMLTTIIFIYLTLMLALYLVQRSLLYFPTPIPFNGNDSRLTIDTDGVELKIETANLSSSSAILYFGGNAESVFHSIRQMQPVLGDNALYFMNYRGYGGSKGKPTEDGLYQDAISLYDYAAQRHDKILLVGRSLGTGVVTYLASQREIERVVLISPYDSIAAVASAHYPIFPVKWLIKDKFDSFNRAHLITSPALILAAKQDRVVPVKHTQRLIEGMTNSKLTLHLFEDAGHNDIEMADGFNRSISRFVSL